MDEILVPLDLIDAIAMIERLTGRITDLKSSFNKEKTLRCQCEFDGGECYSECKYHGKQREQIAALTAEHPEWLCEKCNTVHQYVKGDGLLQICPVCGTTLVPSSVNLRKIAALTEELKSLTEAYNNTDWKKKNDEQKDIINRLVVTWGKKIRQLTAELTAANLRSESLDRVVGECVEKELALEAEVDRLKTQCVTGNFNPNGKMSCRDGEAV